MYDIAFITYNCPEPATTERYIELIKQFPNQRVYRVNGVKGIHQAHIEAAKRAKTDMFYVIDADAKILPGFKFDLRLDPSEEDIVHVWRAINPVNGLDYGNGGIKLLPTELTKNLNVNSTDMTTSISPRFKAVDEVSNITMYNTDPLSTWRSAFRECAKLSSKIIPGQVDYETEARLDKWVNYPSDAEFAEYSRGGASAGQWYGSTHKGDLAALSKINDYDWLAEQFEAHIKLFPPETFK